jgi:hypothetical protein
MGTSQLHKSRLHKKAVDSKIATARHRSMSGGQLLKKTAWHENDN